MSDIDDIDQRFNALTAQISQDERQRMARSAARGQTRPLRRGRRRRLRIAAVIAVAVLAGAGLTVTYRPDLVDGIRTGLTGVDGGMHLGAVPEETMPVDVKPVELSPFYGSPAEKYAEGAKGLVMPEAKAMGGLSRKEVSAALERAGKLLAASHLDRGVLMGGRPKKLIALLEAEQREWFARNLDRRGKSRTDSRSWVTSLAPGTAELAVRAIKVDGETRLSVFRDHGRRIVRIKVNYLFVYAIRRPGQPATTMRLVAHSTGTVEAWKDGGRLRFWVAQWNSGGTTPARCDVDDGFVHPFYSDSETDEKAAAATGAPTDPYSREETHGEGCQLASRT
ncbi:hypothetical protein [Streptosporangium sp. NBC_01756]|uniref:hypothetical protein n=1 Tax=Streptosporangium sp. NBC_01756 TaxID=2975950 RepID=UPI002DD95804|nr:hypothetical protein [Streptosporangium sp. NBC_01756]WSC84861.1 hypothetical protein OIE48_31485 [Streptosporangium sp. NBC_01756]